MSAINLYNAYINRIIALLVGIIAISACLYVSFLLGAIAHASGRTNVEASLRKLSSSVGSLEGKYLAETQSLSHERALALGFVAPTEVSTVFADPKAENGLTVR